MSRRQIKAEIWGREIRPVAQPVTKASAATGAILQLAGPGRAVWNSWNIRKYTREGYGRNADVHAVVNWIASAIAGIKFAAYVIDLNDEEKRDRLTQGPAAKIAARPNETQSWQSFIEQLVIDLLTTGNAYVERNGPSPTAPPAELWLHRPERMEVVPADPDHPTAGLVSHFKYADTYDYRGVGPVWYPDKIKRDGVLKDVHKILHLKLYNPHNDWYGLSPMEPAAKSIDQNNAAEDWNTSLLQNGGRPSGVISIDGISEEQRLDVEEKLRARHTGPANVGKMLVVNGAETKYTAFTMNAQELSWLEGQEKATLRVCAVYRVPAELIGATKFRTFNNMHEAKKSGYTEGALPRFDYIVGEFNHWLAPFYGQNIRYGYDKNDIEALQEDRQFISDRAAKFVAGGIFTPNDARKLIGENALPDATGNVLYIPTTLVPTKTDGKPANHRLTLDPAEPGAPARAPRARAGDIVPQPSAPAGPKLVPKPARN